MKRPKCRWVGRGRYRPVKCSCVATWVIFLPLSAAIRCAAHARNWLDHLERHEGTHGKCPLPREIAR